MLYFRYGSYTFPAGAVEFSTSTSREYSSLGKVYLLRRRMDLKFEIQADTPALLTGKIQALYNSLVPGYDFGLYEQNGNPTAHVWRNSEAFGGIRVVSDASPVGDGTEYVTFRTVNISVEGDFLVRGADDLLSFNESVEVIGDGGPEEIYMPVLRGKWPKQTVSERSIVTATQSGEISIFGRKPTWSDVPKPLWPSFLVRKSKRFNNLSQQIVNGDTGECKASYSYSFEANVPLT